jgi:hypothetical protein
MESASDNPRASRRVCWVGSQSGRGPAVAADIVWPRHFLQGEIARLTVHAEELADAVAGEPAPPLPGVIEDLRAYLADAIASGAPAEREAAIEAVWWGCSVWWGCGWVGRLGLEPRTHGLKARNLQSALVHCHPSAHVTIAGGL